MVRRKAVRRKKTTGRDQRDPRGQRETLRQVTGVLWKRALCVIREPRCLQATALFRRITGEKDLLNGHHLLRILCRIHFRIMNAAPTDSRKNLRELALEIGIRVMLFGVFV